MVRFFYKYWVICFVALVANGCSVFELKLESDSVPLTKQELNMRILTREYAKSFFTQVEDAAEQLSRQVDQSDTKYQSNLLLWQIYAFEGMQNSAYQASPMAGLIDSWVFTLQMDAFFSTEAGQNLFASSKAKMASHALALQFDTLASKLLSQQSYQSSRTFSQNFAKQHPFTDIWFRRSPAFNSWLKSQGIDESEAVSTLGSMPEALGDVSDRLSLVSEQTPKIMAWKAELIARNSTLSGEKLNQTLDSITQTSYKFQDFVTNNPEYMRYLAKEMSKELKPLIVDIDLMTDQKLERLTQEREAFDSMVSRERIEIAAVVTQQRTLLTEDMDKLSKDVVTLAIQELTKLIKSVLIYFILFVLVIFFAPFALGYFVGKRAKESTPIK